MSSTRFITIVFFISVILCAVDTAPPSITCAAPNECVGQSLTADEIYSRAYNSASASNSSMNCTSTCQCEAAFDCDSISSVRSRHKIECDGSNSCTNAAYLRAPAEIDCDGSNACSFAIIHAAQSVQCDGDRACEHAYISGAKAIEAKGAYSLLNATVDSAGITAKLYVLLLAYHSGFGATIICRANATECQIRCTGNGCHNLFANCIGKCSFMRQNPSVMDPIVFPITNLSLFDASTLDSWYDSRHLSTANNMECDTETSLTFDHFYDFAEFEFDNETLITADSTVCCRGAYSCRKSGVAILVESTINMKHKLICSGRASCREAMIENYIGNIFCSAAASCMSSEINTTQSVYCLSSNSCYSASIHNSPRVICSAYKSCFQSNMYSSGLGQLHYFYFLGLKSAEGVKIYCKAKDECIVICAGSYACSNTVINCDVGCRYKIECNGDSKCPLELSHHPTKRPIMPPTPHLIITLPPTQYPTKHPTIYNTETLTLDRSGSETAQNSDVIFGMVLIGSVALMPVILMVVACLFHRKRAGTDRPDYIALFIYFGGMADWYTDVFWVYSLGIEGHSLWIAAFIFVFGSHFVSIVICVYWIAKWRQERQQIHIAHYANKYDKFVICLSVVSGFYGATALITSHMFHLRILSLCLDNTQLFYISTIKIFNQSLLENVPILIVQILYLNSTHSHSADFITLLAMFFTIISIVIMVFTLAERCITHMADRRSAPESDLSEIAVEFILQSKEKQTIKHYHIHSHSLLTDAIRTALEIEISQVKIRRIQKVNQGIKVTADLVSLQEETAQHILDELSDNSDLNQSASYCALLNECKDRLAIHLGCIALHIVHIEREERDDESEMNTDQERMLGNVELQQDWSTIHTISPRQDIAKQLSTRSTF